MKRIFPLILLLCCFINSQAQVFEVESIQQTGVDDKRINIVFLADGYLEEDLEQYLEDVKKVVADLFKKSPFKEYQKYFNVYAIKSPSNERGAARDPDELIDNLFGSTYNYGGIDRLLVPTKVNRINNVLADNFPEYDQVFVLVNDEKYGGSGGWLATSSVHSAASQISIHEIGHSMANLADEYWAGPQYAEELANMTREQDSDKVRWKNWFGYKNTGIYPFTEDPEWRRPHRSCIMERIAEESFCPVCTEAFVTTFYELTSSIDDYSPEETGNYSGSSEFTSTTKEIDPNTLETYWLLDGDTVARDNGAFTLDIEALSDGDHVLSFNSADLTEYSRKDEFPIDVVTWNLSVANGEATSTSSAGQVMVDRATYLGLNEDSNGDDDDEDVVTSIDNEFARTINLKAAPNPADDYLTISFYNPSPAPFNLQLVDLNGNTFQSKSLAILEQGQQNFVIDVAGLDQGMFLVQLMIGSKLMVKKILK